MIRTIPYRWFYIIVHACCFCMWKGFSNLQSAFNFLFFSYPLKCFAILSHMANIDFLLFSPFAWSFLWWSAMIVFCGLQLLSNNLTITMFLLIFLGISSFCLPFWLSFSLLQKHSGVFLFWFSLLLMDFMFFSCL